MSRNRLDRETSAYLRQHADNPVHWHPWGAAAFDEAQRLNKPILLSIGYSACHWCHVMAHESFADAETAALMNELFVNIKVDREERPDVDALYQTALALITGRGGWPLTLLLTPYGEPFYGGTYFPPVARQGAPPFRDVLRSVHQAYVAQPDKIENQRVAILSALAAAARPQAGDGLSLAGADAAAARLHATADPTHGGFGGAPKFPQAAALQLLWRTHLRGKHPDYRAAVLLSAERMCEGGIYDHIGGGFHRYATDERWLVPHFEKMLYDNALLIDLLALLWQATKDPLFARRIRETANWALREMALPDGGFASTQDADSEGEEGRFYVWSAAAVDQLLGDDSGFFKAAYDISAKGNWEGRNIPNRLQTPPTTPEREARLAALRERLFIARTQRPAPHCDAKVQADWNGLMIAALANAATVFEEPAWLAAAERAFAFVRTQMAMDGRLAHGFCDGRRTAVAILDDYANMARAALVLHEATGQADCVAAAEEWVAVADRHYWDRKAGGYFLTADDSEGLITRMKTANDQPLPSGNGTLLGVLARLHMLTGKTDYRTRAEAIAAAFGGAAPKNPAALATLLNEYETLQRMTQVVLIGGRDEAATERLRRVVFESCLPNRLLMQITPGTVLPAGHPAAGKTARDGRPTAYVCAGTTCSLPICDADSLRAALAGC
ncbi:MAG: thioredoxin domain-containing protein [Alphaproteobacteria bacterium]|nr:thioredoxin domain-containing protein [Alphaproteobacteria bacterium]